RLGDEYRKLEQSIEHAHTDVEKAIANENRLQQRVAELQEQDTGADADVEKAREQLTELNRERDQAAEAVSEQKIAAARARQQAESLRENAARAAQQETEIGKDMQRRRDEASTRVQKLAKLREEIAHQQGSLEQLTKTQEQAQQKLNACREERRRLLDISGKAEQGTKEGRDRLAAAQQELHKAEVKLAGVEADIQHARTALYEQYGITGEELDNLDAETLPEIRNRQQASQDLRKLRARMTQMGEVNLGAIEEVQRLEERMTFLTTQRADLTDARDNLLRVITEIDSETRERFMNTLNQLREAFAEVFTRLFGGGTTNIKLNDQENVLESGLDIIVQPPGKKAPEHAAPLRWRACPDRCRFSFRAVEDQAQSLCLA
ncbi:MAG TPA: hypothetical protein VHR86_09580, partial [Armatimonadota bacterium]|nr:hypothetical protein [Armatimonadota bacterium]